MQPLGISWSPLSSLTQGIINFQALKQLPREKVQLATKFGRAGFDASGVIVKGTPEYVRSCCEASLKCLDVDYIDLYYIHRIDASVPIEYTVSFFFSFLSFFHLALYIHLG